MLFTMNVDTSIPFFKKNQKLENFQFQNSVANSELTRSGNFLLETEFFFETEDNYSWSYGHWILSTLQLTHPLSPSLLQLCYFCYYVLHNYEMQFSSWQITILEVQIFFIGRLCENFLTISLKLYVFLKIILINWWTMKVLTLS